MHEYQSRKKLATGYVNNCKQENQQQHGHVNNISKKTPYPDIRQIKQVQQELWTSKAKAAREKFQQATNDLLLTYGAF